MVRTQKKAKLINIPLSLSLSLSLLSVRHALCRPYELFFEVYVTFSPLLCFMILFIFEWNIVWFKRDRDRERVFKSCCCGC